MLTLPAPPELRTALHECAWRHGPLGTAPFLGRLGEPVTRYDVTVYEWHAPPVRIDLHEPDARVAHVPEAVIQEVWQQRRFDATDLRTTDGAQVTILDPGTLNTDGGPDFRAAHLRLSMPDGLTLDWRGDVEVHRTSGEWLVHRHHEDPRYDRTVLHVVLCEDAHTGTLPRHDGTTLPEVVLYPRLQTSLRRLLHDFYAQSHPDFPCAPTVERVPAPVKRDEIRRLGLERIRAKTAMMARAYAITPNLDELLYRQTLRALGYSPNADAMHNLALRVPLATLRTCRDPRDAEALLVGAAGLLPSHHALVAADAHTAAYALDLRARFAVADEREPVRRMSAVEWQYFRLRPANFPLRRIAQAAALTRQGGLFHTDALGALCSAVHAPKPVAALRHLVRQRAPGSFWDAHVRLDRRLAKDLPAAIGQARADVVLTNALLPVLLLHAAQTNDAALDARVLDVYDALPAPRDALLRTYRRYGFTLTNALDAQGVQQLHRSRCTQGGCLVCGIGQAVLRRHRDE
ncbi:MAG: DUF2851 family protein [Bacteroidota bacterium]